MNQKTASRLRKLAGYKSEGKTPSELSKPEMGKPITFPVIEIVERENRTLGLATNSGKVHLDIHTRRSMRLDVKGNPVMTLEFKTKPRKLVSGCAKAIYRELKRAA